MPVPVPVLVPVLVLVLVRSVGQDGRPANSAVAPPSLRLQKWQRCVCVCVWRRHTSPQGSFSLSVLSPAHVPEFGCMAPCAGAVRLVHANVAAVAPTYADG